VPDLARSRGQDGEAVIRIAIVSDVRLYRDGLAMVLSGESGLVVVASAAPCDVDAAALERWAPHIVLVDSGTIRTSNIIAELALASPRARVIAVAVQEDAKDEVIACAEAGVAGFVARDASAAELVDVIRTVTAGEARCSPRVTALLLQRLALTAARYGGLGLHGQLTLREREIVALIEAGLSNKDIARRLHIEVATVKNHVHSILGKFGVRRRGEAAAIVRARNRSLARV
jgi:DNA-binding NarL/FixJ family response regulator